MDPVAGLAFIAGHDLPLQAGMEANIHSGPPATVHGFNKSD